MYDYKKLRGRIKEKLGSESKLADLLGLSTSSVSAKLNSLVPFSLKEMDTLIQELNIPVNEIYQYFFAKKVEKNSTEDVLIQELDNYKESEN